MPPLGPTRNGAFAEAIRIRHALARHPFPLPLVGNAHQIRPSRMHEILENWADRYGPFYRIKAGHIPMAILSDALPRSYIDGYKKAQRSAPALATNYIHHTTIGDPLADALIEDLAPLPAAEAECLIKQAINGSEAVPATAPASLENFVGEYVQQPPWLDFEQLQLGCRMFHRNTQLAIAAMAAGVLVEGFSTNIAQSFFLTGGMRHHGIRRLRQNNRHMLEIFMPGGLSRYGDGWALTIRIRLVHAKIRQLLANSDEWDTAHLGLPISLQSGRSPRQICVKKLPICPVM